MDWQQQPLPGGLVGGYQQCAATATMQYDTGGPSAMVGTTYASYIVTYHPDSQPEPHETGWFDGHETFVGSIAGLNGTFVVRSHGDIWKGKVTGTWTVMEGTGKGALTGIRGDGWYEYTIAGVKNGEKGKGGMTVEFDEDRCAL